MSTVSLNIYTAPYPGITVNHVEIRVYKQSAPLAIIASLNYAPPHGDRTWAFPGLERTNLLFRIFEMNGAAIVQQLGSNMDVVPSNTGGINLKATEQIQADMTTGFSSGINTFTFDGTGGIEDWRGWDISTIERIGTGAMKKNVDYSWNPTTGRFDLLLADDVFGVGEWYNVEFEGQPTSVPSSIPQPPRYSSAKLITDDYSIDAGADFGGVLIIDPVDEYMEVTLPDITTVPDLKVLTLQMRSSAVQKCAKIKVLGADIIDWLRGGRSDLYICNEEEISFYRFIDPAGPTDYWRTCDPDGNFRNVGQSVDDDNLPVNVFNKILKDGTICDVLQYARLYNDVVLQLGAEAVNYDDWATGNNKYKFSLANSANPANVNKFHVPDRRNLFRRNTDGTRLPGAFQAAQVGQFTLSFNVTKGNSYTGGPNNDIFGNGAANPESKAVNAGVINNGVENRVMNVAVREYLLV